MKKPEESTYLRNSYGSTIPTSSVTRLLRLLRRSNRAVVGARGCQHTLLHLSGFPSATCRTMRLTLVARVSDGLPLAASMEDEKEHRQMDDYKTQAKKIVKRLNSTSPPRISIESGGSFFQCAAPRGVRARQRRRAVRCCAQLYSPRRRLLPLPCGEGLPKAVPCAPQKFCPAATPALRAGNRAANRLAFNYLEELQTEFMGKYREGIETASRPYAFIKFGAHQIPPSSHGRRPPAGTCTLTMRHRAFARPRRHLHTKDEEDVRRYADATQSEQNERRLGRRTENHDAEYPRRAGPW